MALKPDPADVETQREGPSGRGRDSMAAASTVEMPAPVGAFDQPADRFAELGELGRGGMGRVIDAYDRALGRSVAVKTIMSTDATDVARFEREAQITARLEHPGIVPIHDAGRDAEGQPYYVMRKVDGRPLSELVDRPAPPFGAAAGGAPPTVDRPAPPFGAAHPTVGTRKLDARLALVPNVLAACDAVAFAHARRVIHRDIKPTNILVGPFGETLVIDWGLARAYDLDEQIAEGPAPILDSHPELTRAGAVAGTPGFMSPEQARGEVIDARADVYALGATLYYVLTGKLAFRTTSATEIMSKVGANQDADWSQLDERTPADLVAILKKAMAPKASNRYADAGELAADLRQYVTGKLVGARDYTWYEQLGRFARRHKPVIAVALVALVIIAVGTTLSVRRVIAERDAAEQSRVVAQAGQREATDKRDELLVRHAMDLTESDPAAAIAVLRRLAPDSTQWRAASVVAGAAFARGIPRGYAYPAPIVFTSFSPSGKRLLVKLRDHALWVQEVTTGERTLIGTYSVGAMQWIDERTILGTSEEALNFIDTETSTMRVVPAGKRASFTLLPGGVGYVLSEGTVYALDPELTVLGPPLATGLVQATTVQGHGIVHIVGDRAHILTPTGDRELPGDIALAGQFGITGVGPLVIATAEDRSCVWNPAPEGGAHCSPNLGQMAMVGDSVAASRGNALVVENANGQTGIMYPGAVTGLYPTRSGHGAVALTEKGTIFLALPTHSVELPPRPPGYQRAMTSEDDRYVAAVAGSELMIFDLQQQSLRSYQAPGSVAAITSRSLYTLHMLSDISRIGLDGTREVLDMPADAYQWLLVDATDRWLVAQGTKESTPYIRDATTKRITKLRPMDIVLLDTYPVAVGPDGHIGTLATGEPEGLRQLDGNPVAASTIGDWLAVGLRDGRLCRIALVTDARSCTFVPTLLEVVLIDAAGVVWVSSERRLWRWDGVLLTYEDLDSPILDLVRTEHYVIAQLANAIYAHDGVTGRVLPLSVGAAHVASDDRLIAGAGNGRVRVIDLPTGLSYDMFPADMVSDAPVVSGSSIAFRRPGHAIFRFDLIVPTEPAALRKWLHEVTNLVDLSDSEVVAWPTVTDP